MVMNKMPSQDTKSLPLDWPACINLIIDGLKAFILLIEYPALGVSAAMGSQHLKNALRKKHRELDTQIAKATEREAWDRLQDLKKQKLQLRDRLAGLPDPKD